MNMQRLRHLLLLLALLMTSCASGRYSLGGSTSPGNVSEVQVLGDQPRISVENLGPGRLHVTFDSPDDAVDESVTIDTGMATRTLPGPVRVRLEPVGGAHTVWRLTARRSGGLRADLLVERESGRP